MTKIKFGQEIFYGATPEDIPYVQLAPLDKDVIVSYSGPDCGLRYAESRTLESDEFRGHHVAVYYVSVDEDTGPVAGCRSWSIKCHQAYGICLSLYEQHPVSMKMSGEPIADCFAVCARRNNTILLIADGVNWGESSRMAARCALYGSMKYLNYKIFSKEQQPATTQDLTALLRKSVDEAHRAILARDGGLTTVCACMVAPVVNSDQHVACCVNVGDSYGFVYSHNRGIREVTIGSHDVLSERNIRDAGGAIGPVDGQNPELHNLTCSATFCNHGDVVFLTTDGISDNFDPIVTKVAVAQGGRDSRSVDGFRVFPVKPEMSPEERYVYALKEMERVIHEYELLTEEMCTAQDICSAMVQHVLVVTDGKRKILEDPGLYRKRRLTNFDRKSRDNDIMNKMAASPGKLDHASIVGVEVGGLMVENTLELTQVSLACITQGSLSTPTAVSSPASSSRRLRARNLLAKLKNLPSFSHKPSTLLRTDLCSPVSPSAISSRHPIRCKECPQSSRELSLRNHNEKDVADKSPSTSRHAERRLLG